jgi:hypothetical protein
LSGPTLVNTSNVVLQATVMPEWRRIFEIQHLPREMQAMEMKEYGKP